MNHRTINGFGRGAGPAGVIPVAGMLVTLALGLCGCRKPAPVAPPPPVVQVLGITATNVPLHAEFIGQLDSPQNVEVRARVEAFVDQVLFVEGSEVKEGALLFALDKKPFLERLATANGMLAEAKAALNKYQKDVDRLTPLAAKRAIPQQDLDNAIASVDIGKANVQSAESRVTSATIDLGYCDVKAPLTGLIGARQVPVGSLVGKGEPTLLATISQLDPIWFYCSISEAQYLRSQTEIRRNGRTVEELPITLLLSTGLEHPEKGRVVFQDRAVDPRTGTLRVRAAFPNPAKILRPGMFGRIRVDIGSRPESVLVPERAVVELQGRNFVWVIDAASKASQRAVRVGDTIGGDLLIIDGLKPGERIVTEGLQKVREGGLVQPRTAAEMAAAAAATGPRAAPAAPGASTPRKE